MDGVNFYEQYLKKDVLKMPFSNSIKIILENNIGKDENHNLIPDEAEALSDGTAIITFAQVQEAIDDIAQLENSIDGGSF